MRVQKNEDINVYTKTYTQRSIETCIPDQKWGEKTQMPINLWMAKQNVVYTYDGILFVHEKEWSNDASNNTDEPWDPDAKWKKSFFQEGLYIIWFHLHEKIKTSKFVDR